MDNGIIRRAVFFLGLAFVACIVMVGLLAWNEKNIPDVLVATTTGILGLLGGILVPTGGTMEAIDVRGKHEA